MYKYYICIYMHIITLEEAMLVSQQMQKSARRNQNHLLAAFPCTGNWRTATHYFFFFLPVSTLIWAQHVKPKGQDLVSMNKKLRAGGQAGQAVCSLQVLQLRA